MSKGRNVRAVDVGFVLVTLLAVGLMGCPCVLNPPKVVKTTPADKMTGVSVNTTIVIEFDREAQPNSLQGTLSPDPGYTDAWNSPSNTIVTVTPAKLLDPNTLYTVTITQCHFVDGCGLTPQSFSFTTGPLGESDMTVPISGVPGPDGPGGSGTMYHVDVATGNDSNDGLLDGSGPWKTINKAVSTMKPGDSTKVHSGTYAEAVLFSTSGAPGAPITLSGEGPDKVIIEGGGAQFAVRINANVSHITIEGVKVVNTANYGIGAGSEPPDESRSSHIVLRDIHVDGYKYVGIFFRNVDEFELDDLLTDPGQDGGNGVHLINCTKGTVTDSTFRNSQNTYANGLETSRGESITVRNCAAYGNQGYGFDISMIEDKPPVGKNMTIEECIAYDNGHSGFAVNDGCHDILFRRNLAWHNSTDPTSKWGGFVSYTAAYNVRYEHNVAFNNDGPGFIVAKEGYEDAVKVLGPLPSNLISYFNNISHNNSEGALLVEGPQGRWTVDSQHNDWSIMPSQTHAVGIMGQLFTPDQIMEGTFGIGDISLDPLFVDPNTSGRPTLSLQSGSPCIDRGLDLGGRSSDDPYTGSAPDIGRFEYGAP